MIAVMLLLEVVFLALIPIVFLISVYKARRLLILKYGGNRLITGISLIIALSPVAWYAYSYRQFIDACKDFRGIEVVSNAPLQNGLLLRPSRDLHLIFGKTFSRTEVYSELGFSFLERESFSPYKDPQAGESYSITKRDLQEGGSEWVKEAKSEYAIETSIHRYSNIFVPLYVVSHSIIKISDETLIAKANELNFGLGFLSNYIGHLYLRSNNPQHFVCGYIDLVPSNTANAKGGRVQRYLQKDKQFLTSVFGKRETSSTLKP